MAAVVLAFGALASPARAQTTYTWVDNSGSNSNWDQKISWNPNVSLGPITGDTAWFTGSVADTGCKVNRNINIEPSIVFDSTAQAYTLTINNASGGTLTVASLSDSSANTQTIASNAASIDFAALDAGGTTMNISAGTMLISAPIISGGSLTKKGNGVLQLFGNNGYTGLTTVSAGVLQDSGSAISGPVLVNGGTYQLTGADNGVGTVTISSGLITGGTLTGTSYSVSGGTISAPLAGSSATLNATAGTTHLTANNSYGGLTTVSGGVLVDTGNGVPAALTVSGGTYDLTGAANSVHAVIISSGLIDSSVFAYLPSTNIYTMTGSLTPYAGYWIHVSASCALSITAP